MPAARRASLTVEEQKVCLVTNAKLDPEVAKLPGVFTTPEQWKTQAIIVDHKLRGEKTGEWRKWFAENIMN